jgi:hypothetical protein
MKPRALLRRSRVLAVLIVSASSAFAACASVPQERLPRTSPVWSTLARWLGSDSLRNSLMLLPVPPSRMVCIQVRDSTVVTSRAFTTERGRACADNPDQVRSQILALFREDETTTKRLTPEPLPFDVGARCDSDSVIRVTIGAPRPVVTCGRDGFLVVIDALPCERREFKTQHEIWSRSRQELSTGIVISPEGEILWSHSDVVTFN